MTINYTISHPPLSAGWRREGDRGGEYMRKWRVHGPRG
jgi:hypothetical protein